MAEFVEENVVSETIQDPEMNEENQNSENDGMEEEFSLVDVDHPKLVLYCSVCGLPHELCEYGPSRDLCFTALMGENPDAAEEILIKKLESGVIENEGDKKSKKGPSKKKADAGVIEIIISVQARQKRKFITTVTGIESVPELKIKDVARFFGKKFSCGASISDAPEGKSIVIQGDVVNSLPSILVSEFKIPADCIYIAGEGKTLNRYEP